MRKQIVLVGVMMLSAIAFGQKKEIKKAEKAIKSGDISEAIALIGQAEGLISGADSNVQANFYVVKGEAYLADAGQDELGKMKTAGEAFVKAKGLNSDKFNERAQLGLDNLRTALVNSAVADQNSRNFSKAAEKLNASYRFIPTDTLTLYYAAGNAINAQDYATAGTYYQELLDLGFTGIRKEFTVEDVETGEIVSFPTVTERNTSMLSGQYNNPNERMSPSLQGEILTNYALILVAQGKNEEALAKIKEARAKNPNDPALIRAEADMAYKTGDMERYGELMQEVIATDPNNPELYYNLGVGSAQNGDTEKAKEYYMKALELDPSFANAKVNMAALILSAEGPIVEEMNNLGTSAADNRRYDELKEKRKSLYEEAVPYLESAVELKKDNTELVRTLMNIYSQLGDDDKFKMMKAKLAEMEGGK